MEWFIIETHADEYPRWTQKITMGGSLYKLYFSWNERQEIWQLSISDSDDNLLLGGLRLVPEIDPQRLAVLVEMAGGQRRLPVQMLRQLKALTDDHQHMIATMCLVKTIVTRNDLLLHIALQLWTYVLH